MKLKFKAIIIGASLILSFASVASAATTHHYCAQTVTAYVAVSGAKTASGTTPTQYQTAAVHPKVWGITGLVDDFGFLTWSTTSKEGFLRGTEEFYDYGIRPS
ncbi:hypothetical protein [Paenibacillus humicola]|uniref:hypothetical protein n=1 Tax=Paenibacillus humicola TaxID=3110540 RepID=UPI00237A20C8|nr:hypothetical protein [Paenibacillus humicola]